MFSPCFTLETETGEQLDGNCHVFWYVNFSVEGHCSCFILMKLGLVVIEP